MDRLFLIYRYRPEENRKSQINLYAWTESKAAIEAFIAQRDKKKYRVKVLENPSQIDMFLESLPHGEDLMLNTIMLQCHGTKDEVPFMMTDEEKGKAESGVLRMFDEAAEIDIDKIPSDDLESIIWMLTNFLPVYDDAVNNIGYRPEILKSMFDDGLITPIPQKGELPSVTTYYSLESFIKVLIDDL